MTIQAHYTDAEHTQIKVVLAEGETLGNFQGPTEFFVGMAPGNKEHDALMALASSGAITIADLASTPVDLAAYAKQRQAAILAAGVDINVAGDGQPAKPVLCDGTNDTRADLALLVLSAQANPATVQPWIDNEGVATALTSAEIIALATHAGAWIAGTYAALGQVLAGLKASPPAYTSPQQVDALFAAAPAG